MYVRQIDVEGVDTKFVERYQKLFSHLLPLALPSDRMDVSSPALEFARHFGFLARPFYTRFRILDPELSIFPPGISELTVRTDELAAHRIPGGDCFHCRKRGDIFGLPSSSPCHRRFRLRVRGNGTGWPDLAQKCRDRLLG